MAVLLKIASTLRLRSCAPYRVRNCYATGAFLGAAADRALMKNNMGESRNGMAPLRDQAKLYLAWIISTTS